jgi:putative transcriptional regulator
MPIVINLDVVLAKRKMTLSELSNRVGINISNLSVLKSGRARAIRFSTLDAICNDLGCQPGELIEHVDHATYRRLYGREWDPEDED